MKTARWLAVVFPVLCVLVLPNFADAEGWGLPSWNPFGRDDKPTKASESSWRTGKSESSFASSKSSEPSAWSKVTRSTSSAWNKTTSTLTPWKKPKKTVARPTGVRKPKSTSTAKKTSWYNPTTWFAAEPAAPPSEPGKVGSVSEFLNQKRVPY